MNISPHLSRAADEYAGQPFDLVVTTCDVAKEACPLFPGARRMLHWSFPDPVAVAPAEARLAAFRRVRDGLREGIEQLA